MSSHALTNLKIVEPIVKVKGWMIKKFNSLSPIFLILFGVVVGAVSVYFLTKKSSAASLKVDHVRIEGRNYTNPLLLCDTDEEIENPKYETLKSRLNREIKKQIESGDMERISIYFRDLVDASAISINPEEKYIPASLNKIPLMMVVLDYARSNPDFLRTKFKYENKEDANLVQIIKPEDTLRFGSTYTVEEALEKMIKHSDNASYNELIKLVKYDDYLNLFYTLKIPIANEEGIGPYDYSHFLRVLYNATYLNRAYSEEALSLLTKSNFKDALVAGVPEKVEVAHKFGLSGEINENGNPENRQLHDCGIFYTENRDYLLCVMTKSNQPIEKIGSVIREISKIVYEEVERKKFE